MPAKPKLIRITTASISLKLLLRGQFKFFQQNGFDVLTISAAGPEVKDILAEGVPHHTVKMTRAITPVQDIISLIKLIKEIRTFRPDIVHTHTPKAGLLGMMASWLCGVKIRMHTVAGLPIMEATGLKRILLKLTEQITYACATNVYPNSNGLHDFIKSEFKIVDAKFKIIGKGSSNGIDAAFFSRSENLVKQAEVIREQHKIDNDTVVYCFVGRVVRDKGIVELMEAFRRIPVTLKARLILVGPFEQELDPLSDHIMDEIKANPNIITAGYQQDVRPWMLASDAFVFPSYREGFPNVVMQAACLEVASIVSDINGCNEIVSHEESGLIIPAKNSEKLLNAMLILGQDKQMRDRYAKRSREFVVANFDQQFVWQELLREYKRLLDLSYKIS